MAQYKHNFYGTSYYGATNAYSGIYETHYINTDETLNGTANFKIKVELPKALYANDDGEIVIEPAGTTYTQIVGTPYGKSFSYKRMNNIATVIRTSATCDSFTMHYLATADSVVSVNVEVRKWTSETAYTSTNHVVNIKSGTTQASLWSAPTLDYATYDFIVTFPVDAVGVLNFGAFEIGATHLTVETRAGLNDAAWTTYVNVPYTKTPINGNWYYLEGVTPSYAGKNRLQLKIFMASSDNDLSPLVEDILATSGNTGNRTEDGRWIADIDMAAIASALTKTFRKVLRINWTDNIPAGTAITYRSRSSAVRAELPISPLSVPYVKNVNRLRLKEGKTYGYITTPLINPSSHNTNLQNMNWVDWVDQSYLPPDRVETGYKYELLDEKDAVMVTIDNPHSAQSKLLINTLRNRPFKLRIRIFKRFDKSSPAVDQLIFTSKLHFSEDKVMRTSDVSAVDELGTGEKIVLDVATLIYNLPVELTKFQVEYKLIDETVRPQSVTPSDLYLYFGSEKTATSRKNVTVNPNDKVWVKAVGVEPGVGAGLIKHYQYGGGLSYFETDRDDIKKYPMTAAFTPSLKSGKLYRNLIKSGWPTQYHTVKQGETPYTVSLIYSTTAEAILALPGNSHLNNVANYNENGTIKEKQVVEIPNNTLNSNIKVYWESEKDVAEGIRKALTDKLVHNALPNDNVMAEVLAALAKGRVDWVSEEKIYDGFLNLNNNTQSYQREHTIPDASQDQNFEHAVKNGETYTSIASVYGIHEEDLRWKNNAKDKLATDSPLTGSILIIPSKIILPVVPSNIQISDNPYEIEIVHNSVKVMNELLPTETIGHVEFEVIYKEMYAVRQPVLRGATANTSDMLPHNKVIAVTAIFDSLVEVVAAPYYLKDTDYTTFSNSIDWSLTSPIGKEPAPGNTYYVSYSYNQPVGLRLRIDSDYQVQIGSDRLWRSAEIKEFSGVVEPGKDFRKELPAITEWADYDAPNVYDVDYIIEDNDLWTKTWIEESFDHSYVVGSLMGKRPKDNWLPYIHTGFYYLGKDEYYLFSEPLEVELTDQDIPIAKNVQYVNGKYGKAVQVQPGSSNMVRNSSFQVTNSKAVIRKITF
jgi:hypothetical protein